MVTFIGKHRNTFFYRFISFFIAVTFMTGSVLPSVASAQMLIPTVLNLPAPGAMVPPAAAFIPAHIKGLTLHPENPLQFDFIIDTGESGVEGVALRQESYKLIKYFLASLTVPEEELWVNLSPYEGNRVIPDSFGQTEMGRDLLAQDYLLKQLTASLMYPEDELGNEFWQRVYTKAQEKFGTTEIPLNTFNKIWIIPDTATVYENGASVFVLESHLRVMLEEDYIALNHNIGNTKFAIDEANIDQTKVASGITSEVVREVLIPEIEKEVNTSKTFTNLRQIYNALILATWYKKNLKESLLGQVYVDQNKTKGIDTEDKEINKKIYEQYLAAFQTGVYNYIKEDYDPATQQLIPRKYFSGGFTLPKNWGVKSFNKESLPDASKGQLKIVGSTTSADGSPVLVVTWEPRDVGANGAVGVDLAKKQIDAGKTAETDKSMLSGLGSSVTRIKNNWGEKDYFQGLIGEGYKIPRAEAEKYLRKVGRTASDIFAVGQEARVKPYLNPVVVDYVVANAGEHAGFVFERLEVVATRASMKSIPRIFFLSPLEHAEVLTVIAKKAGEKRGLSSFEIWSMQGLLEDRPMEDNPITKGKLLNYINSVDDGYVTRALFQLRKALRQGIGEPGKKFTGTDEDWKLLRDFIEPQMIAYRTLSQDSDGAMLTTQKARELAEFFMEGEYGYQVIENIPSFRSSSVPFTQDMKKQMVETIANELVKIQKGRSDIDIEAIINDTQTVVQDENGIDIRSGWAKAFGSLVNTQWSKEQAAQERKKVVEEFIAGEKGGVVQKQISNALTSAPFDLASRVVDEEKLASVMTDLPRLVRSLVEEMEGKEAGYIVATDGTRTISKSAIVPQGEVNLAALDGENLTAFADAIAMRIDSAMLGTVEEVKTTLLDQSSTEGALLDAIEESRKFGASEIKEPLLMMLNHASENVRNDADAAIRHIAVPVSDRVAAHVRALLSPEDSVRSWNAKMLGMFWGIEPAVQESAINVLVGLLQDRYQMARVAAAVALENLKAPEEILVSAYAKALSSEYPEVRLDAVFGLAFGRARNNPATADLLLDAYTREPDQEIKNEIGPVLQFFGKRSAQSSSDVTTLTFTADARARVAEDLNVPQELVDAIADKHRAVDLPVLYNDLATVVKTTAWKNGVVTAENLRAVLDGIDYDARYSMDEVAPFKVFLERVSENDRVVPLTAERYDSIVKDAVGDNAMLGEMDDSDYEKVVVNLGLSAELYPTTDFMMDIMKKVENQGKMRSALVGVGKSIKQAKDELRKQGGFLQDEPTVWALIGEIVDASPVSAPIIFQKLILLNRVIRNSDPMRSVAPRKLITTDGLRSFLRTVEGPKQARNFAGFLDGLRNSIERETLTSPNDYNKITKQVVDSAMLTDLILDESESGINEQEFMNIVVPIVNTAHKALWSYGFTDRDGVDIGTYNDKAFKLLVEGGAATHSEVAALFKVNAKGELIPAGMIEDITIYENPDGYIANIKLKEKTDQQEESPLFSGDPEVVRGAIRGIPANANAIEAALPALADVATRPANANFVADAKGARYNRFYAYDKLISGPQTIEFVRKYWETVIMPALLSDDTDVIRGAEEALRLMWLPSKEVRHMKLEDLDNGNGEKERFTISGEWGKEQLEKIVANYSFLPERVQETIGKVIASFGSKEIQEEFSKFDAAMLTGDKQQFNLIVEGLQGENFDDWTNAVDSLVDLAIKYPNLRGDVRDKLDALLKDKKYEGISGTIELAIEELQTEEALDNLPVMSDREGTGDERINEVVEQLVSDLSLPGSFARKYFEDDVGIDDIDGNVEKIRLVAEKFVAGALQEGALSQDDLYPENYEQIQDRLVKGVAGKFLDSVSATSKDFTKGGIDLNPALLDMQIKRDANGVPLPVYEQPIGQMHIEGFLPIIIDIKPITNLPMLLGLGDEAPTDAPQSVSMNAEMGPVARLEEVGA